jgi:hypothetical protein
MAASPGRSRAAGFTDTFTSRYVDTGELRLHAVTGGDGPPLLLVHGWPQTWYQWRMVMPALARDFQVVAVDHQRFALVGHDTGIVVRGREDIFFGAEYAASAWKDDNPVLARIGPATGKALAQFAAADGGRPARERRPRRRLDLWPAIYFATPEG